MVGAVIKKWGRLTISINNAGIGQWIAAEDMRQRGQSWRAPGPTEPPSAADQSTSQSTQTQVPSEEEWWRSERYMERPRGHHRHPRSTGIVLVALGVLLLAANAGVFTWIEWRTMWPLIFIGLGVILLAKQTGWGR